MSDVSPPQRRRQILDLLASSDGPVSVETLGVRLDVSPVTVRRDLDLLERSGAVIRTHGGAMINTLHKERPVGERHSTNALAKAEIAEAAAALVLPGQTVFLDAGTTTSRIAAELAGISGLTLVTSGVNVLAVLAEADSDATVIATGGTLRRVNQALLGPFSDQVVESIYADIAFIGTDCVDVHRGLSSRTPEQNALKALMMRQSRRTVVAADSSKVGATWATHWFTPPGQVELLTDSGTDPALLREFAESPHWTVRHPDDSTPATPADDHRRNERHA